MTLKKKMQLVNCVLLVALLLLITYTIWTSHRHTNIVSKSEEKIARLSSTPATDENNPWIVLVVDNFQWLQQHHFHNRSVLNWIILIVATDRYLHVPLSMILPPRVLFLDWQTQQNLPYNIVPYIPEGHQARKMIGYLYAMHHGANLIYDGGGDVLLMDPRKVFLSTNNINFQYVFSVTRQQHNYNKAVIVNPYNFFFGKRVKMWPRGTPLLSLNRNQLINMTQREPALPLIQHVIVENEFDLDIICRKAFLRKNLDSPPIEKFDEAICVPPTLFAPFNSRSTLFDWTVFSTLYMPIHVTPSSASDVWRSYMAQRLLTDLGISYARLCFVAVAKEKTLSLKEQGRKSTPETNNEDIFDQENSMHLQLGKLIRFLDIWESEEDNIADRMSDLVDDLIEKRLLQRHERIVYEAWALDMLSISRRRQLMETTRVL